MLLFFRKASGQCPPVHKRTLLLTVLLCVLAWALRPRECRGDEYPYLDGEKQVLIAMAKIKKGGLVSMMTSPRPGVRSPLGRAILSFYRDVARGARYHEDCGAYFAGLLLIAVGEKVSEVWGLCSNPIRYDELARRLRQNRGYGRPVSGRGAALPWRRTPSLLKEVQKGEARTVDGQPIFSKSDQVKLESQALEAWEKEALKQRLVVEYLWRRQESKDFDDGKGKR